MTARECRHNAKICLNLARQTSEIYAKMALIELAKELWSMANHLERPKHANSFAARGRRRDGTSP
jgi:hypothetical protein